jgi:phosphoribosylformylglycinamidine synthase
VTDGGWIDRRISKTSSDQPKSCSHQHHPTSHVSLQLQSNPRTSSPSPTIASIMSVIHYYRKTDPPHSLLSSVKEQLKSVGCHDDAEKLGSVETENCFNIQLTQESLADLQRGRLEWLLAETFDRSNLRLEESCLKKNDSSTFLIEFGPRMTFTSAFSSNAVSICQACGPLPVGRLELSRRYLFRSLQGADLSALSKTTIVAMLHDRMTEQVYETPLTSFGTAVQPKPVRTIPILEQGRAALEQINAEMGLGFDDFDLDYYTNLFKVR